MRNFLSLLAFFLLAALPASAQFYTLGDDPGGLKWYSLDTPHYRIIYPAGLDSLSRVYARELERFYPLEALSSGLYPNRISDNAISSDAASSSAASLRRGRRMPVILHAYHGQANGVVTWAPKRMDLFTLPDAYATEPLLWPRNLAVHESRHLSQMQNGYRHVFKPFTWLLGDMFPGAVSAVYPGQHLLEGDAVVAETALTTMGRGRSADFLNYYMSAFDEGDYRNWYRWRYGSFRRYAPNHYALGYMTIAGTRTLYDDPLFMSRYFDKVSRRPLRIGSMRKEISRASGKRFHDSWDEIMHSFHDTWTAEAALRGPFMEASPLTTLGRFYTDYKGLAWRAPREAASQGLGKAASQGLGPEGASASLGNLFAIKSGFLRANELVSISPDGSEKVLRPFSTATGGLNYSSATGRLYFSESVPNVRWGLKMSSRIRYIEPGGHRIKNLTVKGRYFNPSASPDGTRVAAVEYPVIGGSALVILSAKDGKVLRRIPAPDSLQLSETAWSTGGLIVSGVSTCGSALYEIGEDSFEALTRPIPAMIKDLRADALDEDSEKTQVLFTCDRTGVNEVYALREEGIVQLTKTKYGAADGRFTSEGFFFSSLTSEGRNIYKSRDVSHDIVNFSATHHYKVADALSRQEEALAAQKGLQVTPADASTLDENPKDTTEFNVPKRYRKLPHGLHLHSWAPLYVSYFNVDRLGYDYDYDETYLGATGFFQNHLGTATAMAGYAYHKDMMGDFRHSGHLGLSYSGLFPVFSASIDINDRPSLQYYRKLILYDQSWQEQLYARVTDRPSVEFSANVSVPLNFSSGGWHRGLVPRLKYIYSNDLYDKSETFHRYVTQNFIPFVGLNVKDNVRMQVLQASVSGYIMQGTPKAAQYPRFGVGAEVGYETRIALGDLYSAGLYGYVYGYLPGLFATQGLRLTLLGQHLFDRAVLRREKHVSTRPRGFSGTNINTYTNYYCPDQLKVTADYAIPVNVGDISCFSPLVYITHFVLTPHFDYTLLSFKQGSPVLSRDGLPVIVPRKGSPVGDGHGDLLSVGFSLTARLSNLIWLPFESEFGIEFDYNAGSSYSFFRSIGSDLSRTYVGPVFRMNF